MDMKRVLLASFLCIYTVGGVNAGPEQSRPKIPQPVLGSWLHCGEERTVNDLKITQPDSVSDEVWNKVVDRLFCLINQRVIQGLIMMPVYTNKYSYGYEIRLRVLPERYSTWSKEHCRGNHIMEDKPLWRFSDCCRYILYRSSGSVSGIGFHWTEKMPRVGLEEDLDNNKFYTSDRFEDVLSCLRESDFILEGDKPLLIQKKLLRLALRQFIMRKYFPEYCEQPTDNSPGNHKGIREQYLDAVDYFIENGNLIYEVCTSQIQLNCKDLSPNIKLPAEK